MISSIVLRKDSTDVNFTRIEVDLLSGKMILHEANYELRGEALEHVKNKHRIYLPCKIKTEPEFNQVPLIATICVPMFWDMDVIENYTQALLDELYLFKHNIPGCKTLKEIEDSFMLEVILL